MTRRSRKRRARSAVRAVPTRTGDDFPTRLRAAREERKLSQTKLERIAGISQAVIANYEAGRYRPGFREILKLCNALRITPNKLMYGREDPFAQQDAFGGEFGDAFRLLDNSPMGGAEAKAAIRATLYLTALDTDDRRSVFAIVQSLVRKGLTPNKWQKFEEALAKLAQPLDEAMPELEHFAEIVAGHPSLKSQSRRTRAPRRSK